METRPVSDNDIDFMDFVGHFGWRHLIHKGFCGINEYLKNMGIKVTFQSANGLLKAETMAYAYTMMPIPDTKVHGANMGPVWGRQDPGGPHVGPFNFAI